VNDIFDIKDVPDAIYFSQGQTHGEGFRGYIRKL
jgi:hypothetical protein